MRVYLLRYEDTHQYQGLADVLGAYASEDAAESEAARLNAIDLDDDAYTGMTYFVTEHEVTA